MVLSITHDIRKFEFGILENQDLDQPVPHWWNLAPNLRTMYQLVNVKTFYYKSI